MGRPAQKKKIERFKKLHSEGRKEFAKAKRKKKVELKQSLEIAEESWLEKNPWLIGYKKNN